MMDKRCFNCSPRGNTCLVLVVSRECPSNCYAKITDPHDYLRRLEDMLQYNIRNKISSAKIRDEMKHVRRKFNIPESELGAYAGLHEVYMEEVHRGEKGSHSEGNVNNAAIKQRMKDNRPLECKLNKSEKQEIYEATKKFEEEHGKLERLGRSLLTRTKVDSYTSEEIK